MIDKFLDYYFFLSNFYVHPFTYPTPNSKGGDWLNGWDAKEYKSVEHAYQAFKADNEAEHEYVRNLDTAGKAKRFGRLVSMRKNWDEIKYELMLDLVRTKFDDTGLAKLLLDTDNEKLVEGNYWHDCVWGSCTCDACSTIEGKNWLGKILMQVREELKNKKK
jgi:ribA/ribD-fused uncharacterized protein